MRLCPALVLTLTAFAQTTPPTPSFEAAELKVNTSGETKSHCDLSNGRLYCQNLQLRFLIAEAWTMTTDDIVGPSWLDDVRVDIVAKAQSPDGDVRAMAQTLLRDRMKLNAHVEQRDKSVYALELWKGQPRLEKSTPPAKPEDADCNFATSTKPGMARMICKHMTMAMFAHEISDEDARDVDMRVVDKTGLEGAWDFTIDFTPQGSDTGGLNLFGAMQAQLGLQLESKHLPVPVLVVDSMEKSPL